MRLGVRHALVLCALAAVAGLGPAACSATSDEPDASSGSGQGSGDPGSTGNGAGGSGGGASSLSSSGSGGTPIPVDPKTCAEAADAKSYVGCEYYPTVVDNIVRDIFDYAVVVANAGDTPAEVTVERLGAEVAAVTVEPNSLQTIYLPWVTELKELATLPFCAPSSLKLSTVHAAGGAYKLTASRPVVVYQFNAIQYAGKGGPPGKDWSQCAVGCTSGCFSFTNDASLLVPRAAMTATYRIPGWPSWHDDDFSFPPYFAVTGTQDGTQVTVKLSPTGAIAGGGGVPTTPAGGTATFTLDASDVVMVVGATDSDFSGSLVTASAPIQVITGIGCTQTPDGTEACDHIEESVFPAETLGKHYFVTQPTGPHGYVVGHIVRIYGNVDGTQLSYPGGNPGGPTTISAGEFVDMGIVSSDFEIVGDHEFLVSSFQLGAGLADPGVPIDQQKGDPDQSLMTAVEQFRTKYVFLAPDDYDVSYVDVVAPTDAMVTIDGATVAGFTALSSGFGVARVQLGPGVSGAHVLESTKPVGIQVIGYGTYTSYQYPGGLNLGLIAPPPPK